MLQNYPSNWKKNFDACLNDLVAVWFYKTGLTEVYDPEIADT
jgi:hypothetical protein